MPRRYDPHARQTGSALASVVSNWGQSLVIKSVQRGTIAITGGTSNTATITAVSTANSLVHYLCQSCSLLGANGNIVFARVDLTNSTTVTASVNTSPGANTTTVGYEVIEFYPGVIKTLQRGTVAQGASPATITSVNTVKSYIDYLGFTDVVGVPSSDVCERLALASATTVSIVTGDADSQVVGFQVVELY